LLMARDRAELLDLLRALSAMEWEQPTVAAPWVVRDVVAHILGDDVSRLARGRDGHQVDAPGPGEPLPAFIHRFNGQWVNATRRASPRRSGSRTAVARRPSGPGPGAASGRRHPAGSVSGVRMAPPMP